MPGLQKKTIEKICYNRIKYWAWNMRNYQALAKVLELSTDDKDKFTDEDSNKVKAFRAEVIENSIITGGAIASMLLGEKVNDYDIYLTNRATATKIAWYYLHVMMLTGELKKTGYVPKIEVRDNPTDGIAIFIKSQGIAGEEIDSSDYGYFELMEQNAIDEFLQAYWSKPTKDSFGVKNITSNAITLNGGNQIVLRFTGEPDLIHENYDFVHATNYWTKNTGLVYRAEALQSLLEKRLVYVGSKFPLCSLFRIRKFLKRDFKISAGEITKIAYDISKLDMDSPAVLHDQLIGVDYAYFREVINLLSQRSKEGKDIDRTYLFSVISMVFEDEPEHTDREEGGEEPEEGQDSELDFLE